MFMTMMTADDDNSGLFPSTVHGWTLAPDAESYSPEDLYRYIDGASELYISFGFKTLQSRRYLSDGWPEITVDLFDMGSSGNAFGIFAHGQENPDHEVGSDSEYLDGLLRFWQGECYVSILCSPETPESRTAVMALGRRIAKRLPPSGGRPAVLSVLPEEGLIAPSIRYFRHHAWQNTYQFVSSENILEIGPDCEAVLAKYDRGGQRPVVLLVVYPDATAAGRAFAGLRRIFRLSPEGDGTAVRLADKNYFAAGVETNAVAAVWHAGGAEQAIQMLSVLRERAAAQKKEGGNEKQDDQPQGIHQG